MRNQSGLFHLVNPRTLAVVALLGVSSIIPVHHGMAQQPPTVTQTPPVPPGNQGVNPPTPGNTAAPTPNGEAEKPKVPAPDAPPPPTTNAYGLQALWTGGDIVSRITLLVMAVMSVGSWYVIVMNVIGQNRVARAYKEIRQKQFWQQPTLKKGIESLGSHSSYRYIAENGVDAVTHYDGSLQESIDLYSWVAMALHRALDTVQGSLQKGLALLGTVGSTAPFVGLFGTVWGIHHALSAISIAGQATLDKVAGPVGEALIMTAIGLATAVPAVLGYNFLVRRNKVLMDQARNYAADVQTVLLGGNLRHKSSASDQGKNVS